MMVPLSEHCIETKSRFSLFWYFFSKERIDINLLLLYNYYICKIGTVWRFECIDFGLRG